MRAFFIVEAEMDPEQDFDQQDDTDFAEGFNAPEAPTATPGQQDAGEPSAERSQQEKAPEYAQLTKAELQELKDRAAAIDTIRATQDKSFGTAFGKIGGIERELQALKSGAAVEIAESEIQALRDDGWDLIANALDKVRSLRAIPSGGVDEAKFVELMTQRISAAQQEQAQKYELRFLGMQHPDWQQVDKDPAFAAWVSAQPADFQQGLVKASNEFDSATVGAAMSAFKASRKQAPAGTDSTRRSRLTAAVTPRGTGAMPNTNPEDDFNAGFKES
jgi:hypothetical protein